MNQDISNENETEQKLQNTLMNSTSNDQDKQVTSEPKASKCVFVQRFQACLNAGWVISATYDKANGLAHQRPSVNPCINAWGTAHATHCGKGIPRPRVTATRINMGKDNGIHINW